MNKNVLKVAMVQMTSEFADVNSNISRAVEFIKTASLNSAEIICFPELFTTGYNLELLKTQFEELAEDIDGTSMTILREAAKESGIYVIAPFIQKNIKGKPYNTAVLIDPSGEISCIYSKIHLFGREKDFFEAGKEFHVINIGKCSIGIIICYDMNFPETCRENALMGADIVFVCSAWRIQDKNKWDILPLARAIDNGIYVVAVNAYNIYENLHLFGGSRIINPYGDTIAFGGSDRESLTIADLDLDEVEKYREQSGVLTSRKPETYKLICKE